MSIKIEVENCTYPIQEIKYLNSHIIGGKEKKFQNGNKIIFK